jgi:hypothetical protein
VEPQQPEPHPNAATPPIAPPGAAGWPGIPPNPLDVFEFEYRRRHETDYVFDFWTQFGWTMLSCGLYGIYVIYQQVRRSRDHIRRRTQLLRAASEVCWARAEREGRSAELRHHFDRISIELRSLHTLDAQFRDPGIWALLGFIGSGIAQIAAYVLLDNDLITHDQSEGAIEHELAQILSALGIRAPVPDPTRVKGPHNVGGRVAATIGTCGLYSVWWQYDSMTQFNQHLQVNWQHEDALRAAIHAAAA